MTLPLLMNLGYAAGAATVATLPGDASAMRYRYGFRQGWVHLVLLAFGG